MDPASYRMVVSTGQDFVTVTATADRLMGAWLTDKGYDISALDEGRNDIAADVTLDHDADSGRDGAYARWRLREMPSRPDGRWESTLVVRTVPASPAGSPPVTWIRLDAANRPGPGRRPLVSGCPQLAAALLDTLDARDGPARVLPRAVLLGPDEVDRVIEELCDPGRRLPIVIAAVPPGEDRRAWTRHVLARSFVQLTGLAVLYVLCTAAEPRLNQELEYHPVYRGGVRTFLPGVDPAWRADAQRHPVVSPGTLAADPAGAAWRLAALPRTVAVRSPLPAALDAVTAVRLRPRTGRQETAEASELTRLAAENRALYGYLEESEQDRAAQAEEISALRLELKAAQARADDLVIDYDLQYEELRKARLRVRTLQRSLEEAGRHDQAHAPDDEPGGCPVYPATFAQLLGHLGKNGGPFPHLVFTGDPKTALSLDEQAVSNWVGMAWDGLLALEDFAAASVSGRASGDFWAWCKNLPEGAHPFSPRKVTMRESDSVRRNSRWSRERTFPVPAEAVAEGRVFMEAHLRIGAGNTVAPRLHFYDDTRRTGRVYLGYLGPHLTNTRTS